MLYNNHDNSGKSVTGEKTTRNSGKANTASSSSKKLNEDHNLNELENKGEQDGRLANGHAGRSFSSGKRSSPVRTANGDYEEESDSGESSNTSTSSCPTGGKKENQKTTQVQWKHRNHSATRSKRCFECVSKLPASNRYSVKRTRKALHSLHLVTGGVTNKPQLLILPGWLYQIVSSV